MRERVVWALAVIELSNREIWSLGNEKRHRLNCGCNYSITKFPNFSALRRDRTVTLRAAVAEELPHFANFGDHV
jgi:hypothetical protein